MPPTLTRARLTSAIHDRVGVSRKDAAGLVEDVLNVLAGALVDDDKVKLSGFGTFEVRDKAARPGRNPRTNSPLVISRRRVISFRTSQVLRKAINEAAGETS
jgi:integration host factor subunit alpha